MRRAEAAAPFTRLRHALVDAWTVMVHGLPIASHTTSLAVGPTVLTLRQWSGASVGSGGFLWSASRRLASYLEAHGDGCSATHAGEAVPSRPFSSLRLLELGSGTGALGLAATVLGAEVTMTDQAAFRYPGEIPHRQTPTRSLLDLARENVRDNREVLERAAETTLPQLTMPVVAELLWGSADDIQALPHAEYDVVCGADILLFTSAVPALVKTLGCLTDTAAVVLIEHTDRGPEAAEYPLDLVYFLEMVEADGLWQPTVVRDHGRHITVRMVRKQKVATSKEQLL
uniref:Calmodulin-lysine N-methyltransferase n=1 Tax=Calcidiscus leptoporus TaxID=127549 RepID=A0A7S0IZV2_9EUKA|mmetsp:Transcript_3099/g.7011  ORF Transcript_3099/g.7011 Transcript_3099/m.7011 type:complete len:286 (+) Transcript_3099:98-955(+)|eukprot:CAMPEP_0119391330 /NCGR_PEP_ID=MMETSP1334-20130426/116668_1 /TAXON_ID=127549 /ORGANISM="Calcidiscus leptoporus, Strain RCC1130" /LENGTH=285 /DNA_ID=CAMNT_0007413987 /DNA_START=29 /DNA_END=889 /DNA_ORIENTATION=-